MDANKTQKEVGKNCTLMLWIILNKSWKQHPTKQLDGHLSHISRTIQSKMNKTYRTQLEKKGQTHLWHSSMDPYTWIWQCCLTSNNLFTSAVQTQDIIWKICQEWWMIESQKNLCLEYSLMILNEFIGSADKTLYLNYIHSLYDLLVKENKKKPAKNFGI